MASLLPLLLLSASFATTMKPNELSVAFQASAERQGVPRVLLEVIGWEATRWNQDATTIWHGYGMMDLVEGSEGPSLERAAVLLDVSPDLLIADYRWNIEGAAVLLAHEARLAHGGALPDRADLLAWWPAVETFSRNSNAHLRDLYAATVYDAVNRGVGARTTWGIYTTRPVPVDWSGMSIVEPPQPATDYAGARWEAAASCNYTDMSRSGSDIHYVIIHTIQGSYSGCIGWFQNCDAEVSAHYVLRSSDGQITQMVREEDKAWHAGSINSDSIGLEHEGYVEDPSTWYTDAMYRSSAALVADIVDRTAVSADRSHILGHYEVPGATHTDPGSGWDWDYYMSLVTGGSSPGTGTILGVVAVDSANDDYATRIPGASVWLSTGESTTADDSGSWAFYDLAAGTYRVYAEAGGYYQGECWRGQFDLGSGEELYCSIELVPDPGDTDDTDDTETDDPVDTDGAGDSSLPDDVVPPPGDAVPLDETRTCGCASGPRGVPGLVGLLAMLGLGLRRRWRA